MENQDKNLSEKEIISRILQGEKPLYEILVRRFNPFLYKIGRSYNYSHDDTQDLMQDTYIDAFKNLEKFKGESGFKTWIIRIMLNNCYRKKEKLNYKLSAKNAEIDDNDTPLFGSGFMDSEKQVENKELHEILEDAVQSLSEDYRMVFSLREINGFNVEETAGLLNISVANVKVRLSRAKEMLRNHLEMQHSVPELFEFNLVYCNPLTAKVMAKIL